VEVSVRSWDLRVGILSLSDFIEGMAFHVVLGKLRIRYWNMKVGVFFFSCSIKQYDIPCGAGEA
jgi:hypothetical protein